MIKSVIAGAVAMAVVSFGAYAAPTIPQGQGKVTFNGTVVDAPCGIDAQSADQSIDFGQVSKLFLENDGESQPKSFDIKLINCDITNFKKAAGGGGAKTGTVSLTFRVSQVVRRVTCYRPSVQQIQLLLSPIHMENA